MKIDVGDSVSHYRLVELLGAGGMAVGYEAQDVQLRRGGCGQR